jgi:hypothetical protein
MSSISLSLLSGKAFTIQRLIKVLTLKKQLMIGVAAGSLCIISLAGIASAATTTKPASLAQEIAAKFNLKSADVQGVIDTHKTEARSYRSGLETDRIAQAVKDGKITQSQADSLTAKLAELKADRPTDGTKPTAAQKAEMKSKMDAFRQWLKDNNIPKNLVHGGGRGGFGRHMKMDQPSNN